VSESHTASGQIVITFKPSYEWEPIILAVSNGVSVLGSGREIPSAVTGAEVSAFPQAVLAGEFVAGPNPAVRQSGAVNFFRSGGALASARLAVYDASGNLVRKISIRDDSADGAARRQVGSWDLKDRKGRLVAEGAYLVKGEIKTRGGKRERVSLVLGVR
jgi:hypothetical protein